MRCKQTDGFNSGSLICWSMSETVERKRLDAFVNEYSSESSEGMGLKVENYEGGGNNMPDESEFYESRRDWLEETNGGKKAIWPSLAKNEFEGVKEADKQELVDMPSP